MTASPLPPLTHTASDNRLLIKLTATKCSLIVSAGSSLGSEFRVEVAQANHYALFCAQTSCAAFWDTIHVLIEHLADVFLADFTPLVLVYDTFDTLKAAEEDQGMAESLILVEIYHLCILGRLFVGDG